MRLSLVSLSLSLRGATKETDLSTQSLYRVPLAETKKWRTKMATNFVSFVSKKRQICVLQTQTQREIDHNEKHNQKQDQK
mmetsp:Transcript_4318/g.11293  ORF Transcript_4318/g.11293 Transcript_4318/m.11293 type:complete len:80 (-) Transcript_4318:226-465(-)